MRRRSLVGTVGRTAVIAGTATAVSGHVSRRQAARNAPATPQTPPAATEPPPPPPAAPVDPIEQLTKLAALKDQGVLTEEEFATQKAKLLAQR